MQNAGPAFLAARGPLDTVLSQQVESTGSGLRNTALSRRRIDVQEVQEEFPYGMIQFLNGYPLRAGLVLSWRGSSRIVVSLIPVESIPGAVLVKSVQMRTTLMEVVCGVSLCPRGTCGQPF